MKENKETKMDFASAVLAGIRADPMIGRGSCSTIDECYSDAELLAEIKKVMGRARVVRRVVNLFRHNEKVRNDYSEDICNA